MATRTVAARITDLLVEHLGIDEEEVTPDARIVDDLGADSLDRVEFAMALEEHFSLPEITDDDVEKLKRVKDVVAYVERRHKPAAV
jgi:acyl carrier protein